MMPLCYANTLEHNVIRKIGEVRRSRNIWKILVS